MNRDRAARALEMCRLELRKACAARNRSAAYYWALQMRDNQRWLKHYMESEQAESQPQE